MGPTSPIPHVKSLLCEDCSLWLELSAAGVEGIAGFLAEGPPPNTSECGGMAFRGVLSHPVECLLRLMFRSPHLWRTQYRFERRVFCNGLPCLSRRLFPCPVCTSRWWAATLAADLIVDPGTGGVLSLCVRNRNNSPEPDSETRDRRTIGAENKSRKTRVTQRVHSEKEKTRETITSVPIPETS